jgi:hypothetical protein
MDPRVDAWSFGVDGYSMGQAWLRFKEISQRVDYDLALLVWVPDKSLPREISVSRYVGFGWESYKIDPRYVPDGNGVRLVPSPYQGLRDLVDQNRDHLTRTLRDHLRRYEGFYLRTQYEPVPILGHSMLLKRWLATRFDPWKEAIAAEVMTPGSEAQRVSHGIFDGMARQVAEQRRDFALVVLPSRLATRGYRHDAAYAERWRRITSDACGREYECVELMHDMLRSALDRGHDGSHYGPRTNALLARLLWDRAVRSRVERRFASEPANEIGVDP